MKYLMLASLAATFSLSALADTLQKIPADDAARTTTVKSSKSNSSDREVSPLSEVDVDLGPRPGSNARGKPSKDQAAREQALQGVDTCEFAIDQKGVKRMAQPQKECKTFNESRSNITDRERALSGADTADCNPDQRGITQSQSGLLNRQQPKCQTDAKILRDGKGKMPAY